MSEELYPDAANFVRETGRATVSAIQRKFKLGYNPAARLLERLQANGVVSEPDSKGKREVLSQPAPEVKG